MLYEPWRIELLGGLRACQGERALTRFRTQKTGALLAFLAYHGRSQPRETLIEMLWPDAEPELGRNSLSQALSSLRSQLEPPGTPAGAVIVAERFAVELNPAAFITDVAAFEGALRAAAQAQDEGLRMQSLSEAMALYRGPLLPGYYEEWLTPEQERLAGRALDAALRLAKLQERAGEPAEALDTCHKALGLDPLREELHREVMRLHLAAGQPNEALHQYRKLERLLKRELGVTPSAATRALLRADEGARADEGVKGKRGERVISASTPSPFHPLTLSPLLPPTGTVTFLLTDIEGSTALWEKHGDAFKEALAMHHALLRGVFRRHGGHEAKEAGDSFLVAFAGAGDALACAVAAQRALAEAPPGPPKAGGEPATNPPGFGGAGGAVSTPPGLGGPGGAIRVRMAIHAGDVELGEDGYRGPALHRAARVLGAAHGRQILCSEAAAVLVRRDLHPEVRLKDLGLYRLRGVEEPERLFQVDCPGAAPAEFPPPNAEPAPNGSIPLQFTRFFGREPELALLQDLLRPHSPLTTHHSPLTDDRPRLVTLTGPGGGGKTRLAIEAAGRLLDAYQGAVWFATFQDLSDARLIPDALLGALHLTRSPDVEPLEQVISTLGQRPALLVLDNFEQLVEEGTAVVQTLLERLPALTLLLTSRRVLDLPGERPFPVPPLTTPHGPGGPEQLSLFESVQLFVDRAQGVKPDFRVTNSNAAAVAELCDRLEGIPLAIELAAARAQVLTPAQLLAQLGNRFEILISRRRGVVERQRTLRAAIDWSYRLLSPELQRFFARLSVFRGGWTVEAAEAVCEEPLALDFLAQLGECSLVLAEVHPDTGEMRFRMLETLREYGWEQLGEGEREGISLRHAERCMELVGRRHPPAFAAWKADRDPQTPTEWARLGEENVRAALSWCQGNGDAPELGLHLALHASWFWGSRHRLSEAQQAVEDAMAAFPGAPPELRAAALKQAGQLARSQQHRARARALLERAADAARESGEPVLLARCLTPLGGVLRELGAFQAARSTHLEAAELFRQHGSAGEEAFQMEQLAMLSLAEGDDRAAWGLFEQAIAMGRRVGDGYTLAYGLLNLGVLLRRAGELDRAREALQEARGHFQELNHEHATLALIGLGSVAGEQGDCEAQRSFLEEAVAWIQENLPPTEEEHQRLLLDVAFEKGEHEELRASWDELLRRSRERGDPVCEAKCRHALGWAAMARGDLGAAREHFGQKDLVTGRASCVAGLAELALIEGDLDMARLHFQEILAAARDAGQRMDAARALHGLARVGRHEGNHAEAGMLFRESLAIRDACGANRYVPGCLSWLAATALACGDAGRAARLFAAVAALCEALGTRVPSLDEPDCPAPMADLEDALGEQAFSAAWGEGRAMTWEQAVAYALERVPPEA